MPGYAPPHRNLVAAVVLSTLLPAYAAANGAPGSADENTRHYVNEAGTLSLTVSEHRNRHLQPSAAPVIDISSALPLGESRLLFGTTDGKDQRRYQLGLAGDRMQVSLFSGSGEDHGTMEQPAADLDPYFFHGGSYRPFDYRGITATAFLGESVATRFAMARISADGAADRDSYYFGLDSGRHGGGLFAVEADGATAATGFELNLDLAATTVRWQQIEHVNSARYRTIALQRDTDSGSWYSLGFESGRNRLYRDAEENRVMFRFGGTLGRQPVALNAGETLESPGEEPARKSRAGGIAVLAGTVVALGVASSSGDEERDSTPRFNSQHEAARIVLNRINPTSVRQNREHGGWIYRNRDGTYGSTAPVAGQVASVDIGIPSEEVPGGTRATASYHTHGGPDPRYDNENFSPADILSDNLQRVDGYLGTPAGLLKFHHFQSQSITTIGRIAH